MEYSQIQSFFTVLMAILGTIITVGSVINLFVGWIKSSPSKKHTELLENHEKRIVNLESKTVEQDNFIKVLCNSILAIVSHEINGNSMDKLKKAKDDLEKFLINK